MAGRAGDQGRQVGDRLGPLDLGDEGERPVARWPCRQRLLEQVDVVGLGDEGIADHVGQFDGGVEIAAVLGGERRQAERGVGQVQPLLGFQTDPAGLHAGQADEGAVLVAFGDDALHLAVVVAHPVADAQATDDFRQRDTGGEGDVVVELGLPPATSRRRSPTAMRALRLSVAIAPVRIFGPATSIRMRRGRPVRRPAARRFPAIRTQSSGRSCAQLMRPTSIPASASRNTERDRRRPGSAGSP